MAPFDGAFLLELREASRRSQNNSYRKNLAQVERRAII